MPRSAKWRARTSCWANTFRPRTCSAVHGDRLAGIRAASQHCWFLQATCLVILIVGALDACARLQEFEQWLLAILTAVFLLKLNPFALAGMELFGAGAALVLLPFFLLGIGIRFSAAAHGEAHRSRGGDRFRAEPDRAQRELAEAGHARRQHPHRIVGHTDECLRVHAASAIPSIDTSLGMGGEIAFSICLLQASGAALRRRLLGIPGQALPRAGRGSVHGAGGMMAAPGLRVTYL